MALLKVDSCLKIDPLLPVCLPSPKWCPDHTLPDPGLPGSDCLLHANLNTSVRCKKGKKGRHGAEDPQIEESREKEAEHTQGSS